jgi:16S rRNA (guanine1207-N2)-methyltransferase
MRTASVEPASTYTAFRSFETTLAGDTVQVWTKRGIPDWDTVPPASSLLAAYAELAPHWQILQIGAGNGALSAFVGRKAHQGKLTAWESSYIAQLCTRRTLDANHVPNELLLSDVDLPDSYNQSFDCVLMHAPKSRALGQRCLLAAQRVLKPGAMFYLAGDNHAGVQSLIRDAEAIFGPAGLLGYKKGNRVVRFVNPPQPLQSTPWMTQPGIANHTWFKMQLNLASIQVSVKSLPGVFSYDRLDEGTQFLLEHASAPLDGNLLDIGCGWGAIGLWAAPHARSVDMVDSNLLAVASSQQNTALSGNIRVLPSDITSAVHDRHYTHVFTNPPFHTGKDVDYFTPHAIIQQAANVLSPGGELWLVANKFIPYRKIMHQYFRDTRIAAEDTKYHLLTGIKPKNEVSK